MRTFSRWMTASRAALSTKACILVSRVPDWRRSARLRLLAAQRPGGGLCPFVRAQLKRPRLPA
jgi:hypothetical protein